MALRLSFIVALLLSAAASVAATDLKFDSGDETTTVLLSFGEASAEVSVLCKDASGVSVSGNTLFTAGAASAVAAAGGYTNYTIPMTFSGGVGSDSYTVECGSESITGTVNVAGFCIKSGGAIVSGESGAGVSVGQKGSTTYDVDAAGPDGSSVDISGCSITARESSGPYMKEVDMERTSLSSSSFKLTIADYRVGTGSFVIEFDCPAISYRGENFETVLKVTQETSPAPKCVVMGGSVTTTNGAVSVSMYNLGKPPQAEPVSTVTMSVGGETVEWDTSASSMGLPDQTAVFRTSAGGKATFKCDGEDAIMMGGDVEVSGDASSPALATELISTLDEDPAFTTISVVVRIPKEDPSTLTKVDGEKVRDAVCAACLAEKCVITSITKGSAVVAFEAGVADPSASELSLNKAFEEPDCTVPKTVYPEEECGSITLEDVKFKAVAGSAIATATGLATWTIVLIAGLGAFALIALIMLGLLAVYRRSAEVSESDYSSSGPLGVPDPSDLLYEQSIVRDIYGRGDFPDGGPTPAVAEQRAREADLREEMPRPPSSSGLSRQSRATDDASSTYSV